MSTATKIGGSSKSRAAVGRKEAEPDLSRYSGRVAVRLRELRKAKGYSPRFMAERLIALRMRADGLSDKNPLKLSLATLPDAETYEKQVKKILARIRHYESGRADLPQDLFPAWAKVLGVTERDLLPG